MSVFISHASADLAWATRVADALKAAGVEVALDRDDIAPGGSFVQFMNEGLDRAEYCLLLWSAIASQRGWVREEWQTAFQRSVEENRAFLVVARIEDHPFPRMLRHRLCVDLFIDFARGMQLLLERFDCDRAAERASGRLVAPPAAPLAAMASGDEIYLTSQLFGYTAPVRVNLQEPCAMVVERFVRELGLPRQVAHGTALGFHISYALARDDHRLGAAQSLAAQGVGPGQLLWLETDLRPFAGAEPVAGSLGNATFRGLETEGRAEARNQLLAAIQRAGLARPGR